MQKGIYISYDDEEYIFRVIQKDRLGYQIQVISGRIDYTWIGQNSPLCKNARELTQREKLELL